LLETICCKALVETTGSMEGPELTRSRAAQATIHYLEASAMTASLVAPETTFSTTAWAMALTP